MRLLIPLFSPATGTWGGLTRVIAIAEAAEKAGHSVAFCASGDLELDLRLHGYQVYPMPPTTMMGLPAPLSHVLEQRAQNVAPPVPPGQSIGNIWLVMMASGLARSGYLKQLVEAELAAAEAFKPDVLFTDLDPGAFMLSSILKLPMAFTYQTVAQKGIGSTAWAMMNRAIRPVLKAYDQPVQTVDEICFASSNLKIISSIPELDGANPDRPDVRYVGHLLGNIRPESAASSPSENGRRVVFTYVGTGSLPLKRLRKVLPEVFPADGDRVCLVGSQSIDEPERVGAVEFLPYVPAESILPHADWTLCHGGLNTIIQSLRAGVPLIIFPGAVFERRFNARKVAEAGAGLFGESNQFTVEWLRGAFDQQARCSAWADRLGERIKSYGGAEAAIDAIENWHG